MGVKDVKKRLDEPRGYFLVLVVGFLAAGFFGEALAVLAVCFFVLALLATVGFTPAFMA